MQKNSYVLDTNIWISYIIKAKMENLAEIILDNEIIIFTCKELMTELETVLGRAKFTKYLTNPIQDYLTLHEKLCNKVNINLLFTDSPDPKDNYLFDLALQHNAHFLVTGDRKLLALETIQAVNIISLSHFKLLF